MDTKRDILRCFIKVHVLFHTSHRPVYGLGLIEELARHGYQLSSGTLYPLLHSMKQEGYLSSHEAVVGGKVCHYYRATALGEGPSSRRKLSSRSWLPRCWKAGPGDKPDHR